MNKNSITKDTLIGSGIVSIKRAVSKLDTIQELSIVLSDGKTDKPCGRVVLHVELQQAEKEDEYKIPPGFEYGTLNIATIAAFNLKNTEMIGLQDPYVVLRIGEEWEDKTFTLDDIGAPSL